MDFGFTNDPTTLIACYVHNGIKIFDEVIYQKGLHTSELSNIMKSNNVRMPIYADSAAPQNISELRRYGFNIQGASKGRDSINYGINLLQQEPFKVTASSSNLINELRSYVWDKDKTGTKLNKPIDAHNHAIDAMRYFATMKMGNKRKVRLRA
jgi:phage terminase large subunit